MCMDKPFLFLPRWTLYFPRTKCEVRMKTLLKNKVIICHKEMVFLISGLWFDLAVESKHCVPRLSASRDPVEYVETGRHVAFLDWPLYDVCWLIFLKSKKHIHKHLVNVIVFINNVRNFSLYFRVGYSL